MNGTSLFAVQAGLAMLAAFAAAGAGAEARLVVPLAAHARPLALIEAGDARLIGAGPLPGSILVAGDVGPGGGLAAGLLILPVPAPTCGARA